MKRSGFVSALVAVALASPAAAQAARSWQAPQFAGPNAQPYEGAGLAVTPPGDAVTAWRDESYVIKGRAVSASGVAEDTAVLGGGYAPPTVSALGTDGAILAWTGSTTPGQPGEDLLVSEWHPGEGFSEPRKVSDGSRWGQPGTHVAANLLGDVVVLYSKGNSDSVWSVRRNRDGDWLEPKVVDPSPDSVWELNVGMSATGEASYAYFVNHWENGGEQVYAAYEPPDGPPSPPRKLAATGDQGGDPSLAVNAAGVAVVTWIETGEMSHYWGAVMTAVKAPGAPFGEPIDTGGSAGSWDGAPVALADDGHAVIAWDEIRPNGPDGGSGYGIWATAGLAPIGVFGPPEDVSGEIAEGPPLVAVDPVGNAIISFTDWDTSEPRVVRRAVGGLYGRARNPVTCPRRSYYGSALHVDALGNATLLWKDANWLAADWPLYVSRDAASTSFSPDPCPGPPPWLTWSPHSPEPGQSVTFDGSGADDPDAARTLFKWDLDGDGTFETDTGETASVTHTFDQPGEHRVGYQVQQFSQRPGTGSTTTCVYTVRVGMPPEPAEYQDPDPWGTDPPPSALPEEDPWPVGPRDPPLPDPDVPDPGLPDPNLPDPNLPVPVLPHPVSRADDTTDPTIPPGVVATGGQRPGVAVSAPARVRMRNLVRRGLAVSVISGTSGRARMRLAAGRRTVAGPSNLLVTAARRNLVVLRVGRAAARRLRRTRPRQLTLVSRVTGSDQGAFRQRIRLVR
jgi:hypothetical protein